MNQKTEPEMTTGSEQEFSRSFLRWLAALTVATLTFLFATERIGLLKSDRDSDSFHRNSLPWVTAGGIVIQQGLSMFSGKEPQPASHEQKHWMVGILLLGFVVGPTILLASWRVLNASQGAWQSAQPCRRSCQGEVATSGAPSFFS